MAVAGVGCSGGTFGCSDTPPLGGVQMTALSDLISDLVGRLCTSGRGLCLCGLVFTASYKINKTR